MPNNQHTVLRGGGNNICWPEGIWAPPCGSKVGQVLFVFRSFVFFVFFHLVLGELQISICDVGSRGRRKRVHRGTADEGGDTTRSSANVLCVRATCRRASVKTWQQQCQVTTAPEMALPDSAFCLRPYCMHAHTTRSTVRYDVRRCVRVHWCLAWRGL